MTNAERQSRFRERQKAQGLKRRDTWQNAGGVLPAEGEAAEIRHWAEYSQFLKELKELVQPIPELEAEEIYAELLRHARQLREEEGG